MIHVVEETLFIDACVRNVAFLSTTVPIGRPYANGLENVPVTQNQGCGNGIAVAAYAMLCYTTCHRVGGREDPLSHLALLPRSPSRDHKLWSMPRTMTTLNAEATATTPKNAKPPRMHRPTFPAPVQPTLYPVFAQPYAKLKTVVMPMLM